MSYADFFQTALAQHHRAEERRRAKVLEQHARIVNLLAPMLRGVEDVIVDQLYQTDNDTRGPIHLAKSIEAHILSCYFILECDGHNLLTIELDHNQVHLKNGVKQANWYLNEFDDHKVQYIAQVIAECIVPRIVETERANGALAVGPGAH